MVQQRDFRGHVLLTGSGPAQPAHPALTAALSASAPGAGGQRCPEAAAEALRSAPGWRCPPASRAEAAGAAGECPVQRRSSKRGKLPLTAWQRLCGVLPQIVREHDCKPYPWVSLWRIHALALLLNEGFIFYTSEIHAIYDCFI